MSGRCGECGGCGGCAAGASSRPNAPRTQWRAISWPSQSNSDSISCPLRPKDRPAERYPRRHRSPRIGRHRFHRRGPCRVPRRARRRDRRARARGVRAGSAHGRAARRPDGPHVARPEVRRRVLSATRCAATAWARDPAACRGRGAPARLRRGRAVHDQLPGARVLREVRLATFRRRAVRFARHESHVHDENAALGAGRARRRSRAPRCALRSACKFWRARTSPTRPRMSSRVL